MLITEEYKFSLSLSLSLFPFPSFSQEDNMFMEREIEHFGKVECIGKFAVVVSNRNWYPKRREI